MLTLTPEELQELTRYKRPADQLRYLLAHGFHRATMHRGSVLLERSHYDAVTRTAPEPSRPQVKPPRVKAAA